MANASPDAQASSGTSPGGSWLVAKGEMARKIAAFPWEKTALGPLTNWPSPLRTATNLVLEAGAPMALIWGREFHFLYNERYAAIIQDKHPAALGGRAQEIFPELWQFLLPLFNQANSGEAVLLEDYELPVTRLGTTKPGYFSFSYNPVRNETGAVAGFIAVVIETTARVVREQERAQVFDTVLSAITDFAYTFDRAGRFTYINKALLDLWGLKLEQAVGKNFFDLNYPADLATHLQGQIQLVITEKKTVRDETRYVSPTGVEGFYEYIFSPVLGPDNTVLTVAGSTRDITSRKKLELEALAAAKAKDDFLAALSHELRTPLNPALLLASEGAKNPMLPWEVRADFQSISENIRLEARLIDDLLDISRITHGKLALEMQPLEIHAVLLRAIESLRADIFTKSLVFTPQLQAAPSVVVGDAVRLHQIFSNLLRNAVKFTPNLGRICVTTSLSPDKAGTLVVEISDSGLGLSTGELGTVFEPFAQGQHVEDAAGHFGGLGLGLAISRKIAELHAGSISARSAGRHQGATFVVELPLDPSGRSLPSPSDPLPTPAQAQVATGLKVLLVEDHASSREVLARLLALRKLTVTQASSSAEALAQAKAHSFDLVISDLGLPDRSGYELMAILKATYGYQGIALSGYGTQQDIERSLEAGFTCHLTKPVQTDKLDAALARFSLSRRPSN